MKKLYKTTIEIWTSFNPSGCDLETLAFEATEGAGICTKQDVDYIEFFDLYEEWG